MADKGPEAVGIVGGYPKSGRTWLRFMLAKSLAEQYRLDIELDLTNFYEVVPNDDAGRAPGQPEFAYEGVIPKVEMSHLPYTPRLHFGRQIMITTRDPRDIMVSHWMHDRNHLHEFDAPLTEFIKDPRGIASFLEHLSSWAPHLDSEQIITYEAMRINPYWALKKVTGAFELGVEDSVAADAAAGSTLAAMTAIEIKEGLAGKTYDRLDRDSRRVRRGKVGGWRDYLSAEDIDYIDRQIRQSDIAARAIICLTGYAVPNVLKT